MISFAGSPPRGLEPAGFGVRTKTDRPPAYERPGSTSVGPYTVYPLTARPEARTAQQRPERAWISAGDSWRSNRASGSFTNHPGVVDYKGHSYLFYHNAALPGGGGFKRSVCVEEFTYGADGAIPAISMTSTGPEAVANLNPFRQVEAETIAFSSGLKTEVCSEGGMNVTSIGNGDYLKVKNVDFGSGASSFEARIAASTTGGSIELHLEPKLTPPPPPVPATGGARTWITTTCTVSGATGLHDCF